MLDVAVIIVSWNVRDYLANCLRSLNVELMRSGLRGEVWVVDNASDDGTVSLLQDLFPHVHLIENEQNVGFGAANNQGMAAAAAHNPHYYFLLNPDTVLRPGSLSQLVGSMETLPNAGMAGAKLVYSDGRFQHSAFHFPGIRQLLFDLFPMPDRFYESRLNGRYPRRWFHESQKPFTIDHPLGASMLVRADVAEATRGFDESFHMYCEEIDWAWRIHQAGWEVYAVPAAEIVHYGGESTGQIPAKSIVNLWRSRAQLYRQHVGKTRFAIARKLVIFAMHRHAAKAKDPQMQQAYKEIAHIWQNE